MLAMLLITAKPGSVGVVIGVLGIVLVSFAFPSDGLVRRHIWVPSFPFGGRSSVSRRRIAVAGGLVALVFGMTTLLTIAVLLTDMFMDCDASLACVGAQLRSVDWTAGVVLAGCIFWFVFVWVCTGNPYKQVLVYGVWYRQDKVARLIFDELQALQLRPLPIERIYALEDDVVRLMHQHELLVHGKSWLDGGKRKAKDVPVRAMYDTIGHQKPYLNASKSEHVAIRLLLGYFAHEAQRVKRMSRLRRWWVGTTQIGRVQVYGRRAL